MRIGINTLFLIPGEVGGSQTYFCETFGAMLEAFPDDGYVLFTQIENDRFLRDRFGAYLNVTFVPLPFRAMNRVVRIIREQVELPWKVRGQALDVLWSPGYTAPVFCRVPQVVSILDMQYRRFPDDLSWLARLTTDILLRLAAWRIRHILTISEFSRSEIVHFLGTDPARITVTHLAASEAFAAASVCGLPSALPASAVESGFLLCVANTYPHKNVHTLVEAYRRIADVYPQALVLVGKARRGEPLLTDALASLPPVCRERVIRLDGLAFPELVALYQRCAVCIFPSLYEGFGLPVVEAMLAGVPVVASDIPTHREVGGTAIAYADGRSAAAWCAAIARELQFPGDTRLRQQQSASRQARSFSWKRTAERTHACLERACAR
jgi:glycosyltransferase involved in cell wall biosynthesis